MRYYPINLDVLGTKCVVVGGGGVGTRKVKKLLECGADVTVISLEASQILRNLAVRKEITLHERGYDETDLKDAFLVIGATNDEKLNQRVFEDAKKYRCLCNIADRPKICQFILPAIIDRGDLVITVSTSGKSPAFAKFLKKELESRFGEEYSRFLILMGAIREKLLATAHEPETHKPLFETLIRSGLLDMIRDSETEKINRLLYDTLGQGYDFELLMKGHEI